MQTLSDILGELQRLHDAATPGPWHNDMATGAGNVWVEARRGPVLEPWQSLKRLFRLRSDGVDDENWAIPPGERRRKCWERKEADANLIVALRNHLPTLLRVVPDLLRMNAAARRSLALLTAIRDAQFDLTQVVTALEEALSDDIVP